MRSVPEVPRADFDAATLRRFADGHRTEDLFFERLRLVPGLEVHTHDAEGRQYGFSDLAGRFKGSVDGVVRGLLQAPKTWHVAEVKCVNEKSFAAFNKLRATQGEKQTLNLWNTRYWAQAQVYMHMLGLTRHWLVALTPGGRDHTSCRTEYDPSASQALVNKAEMILRADEPPARLSEHKTSYKCKYCDFSEVCHGDR